VSPKLLKTRNIHVSSVRDRCREILQKANPQTPACSIERYVGF
jgi:hypothetical protein